MCFFRKYFFSCVVALFVLLPAMALSQYAAAKDTVLKIGGTGSALGGMKLLAEAYNKQHPEVRIKVLPSLGSGGGIKALLAGAIDLSVSARPVKEKERAAGAVSRKYAVTPIVLATAADTPVEGLSLRQLASIYDGSMTSWGDGTPLRLILRPASETDTKLLRLLSADMDHAVGKALKRPGMLTAFNDQKNADNLERIKGSLGTATLGQILTEGRKLKVLPIDGIEPTAELLAKGKYIFSKTLYFVTTENFSQTTRDFMAFVFAQDGHGILSTTGHLPVGL